MLNTERKTSEKARPYVLDINNAFDRRTSTWISSNLQTTKPKKKNGIIHIGHGMVHHNEATEFVHPVMEDISDGGHVECLSLEAGHKLSDIQSPCEACKKFEHKFCECYEKVNADIDCRNEEKANQSNTAFKHYISTDYRGQNKQIQSRIEKRRVPECICFPDFTDRTRKDYIYKPAKGYVIQTVDTIEENRQKVNLKPISLHESASSTLQVFEENHAEKLANFFCHLYVHDQLTDIMIHVGNYSFSAHKVVLACFSPHFAEMMLSSDNLSQLTLSDNVTPTGFKKILDYMYTTEFTIEVESLAEILQAAHILKIDDLQQQCLAIFQKAKLPELLDILETSHKQGVRYICEDLILKIVCSTIFSDLTNISQFKELCAECFCLILSQDDILVSSEFEVANAVIMWLKYAPDERMQFLENVFSVIRLEKLTSVEIMQLSQDACFLIENNSIRENLLRIHWYNRSSELGFNSGLDIPKGRLRKYTSVTNSLKQTETKYTKGISTHKQIEAKNSTDQNNSKPNDSSDGKSQKAISNCNNNYAPMYVSHMRSIYIERTKLSCMKGCIAQSLPQSLCSGKLPSRKISVDIESCEEMNNVEVQKEAMNIFMINNTFDAKSNSRYFNVKFITKTDICVSKSQVVMLEDYIYFIGGVDQSSHVLNTSDVGKSTDMVYRHNLITNQWDQGFPLREPRSLHTVVVVGKLVYCLGGISDDGYSLASVEAMNHENNQCGWHCVENMPSSRCSAAGTVLNDIIYIAGGARTTNSYKLDHILSSVLCFHTLTKTWTQIENLRYARFGASLVSLDKSLYLVGGVQQKQNGPYVSCSDIDIWNGKSWARKANMQSGRCETNVFVVGSLLVIAGGYRTYGEENSIVSVVEVFNPSKKVWQKSFQLHHLDNSCIFLS